MLRVGFDGRDLLRKRTGVVNNATHLARELSLSHPEEFVVYVDRPLAPDEAPPRGVPLRTVGGPALLWKHVALPLAMVHDRIALFHSPTGTLPLAVPCQEVVTIHDLFATVQPGWFSMRMGLQLRLTQRRAAQAANRIIAVSERTRRDLIVRFGVPAERIRVVYNGVDHARFRPIDVDPETVARRFGVPHPFILCVGSLMPWRNAPRLLRAASRLRMGLLFVGRDIWGSDPTQRLAAEHGWDWARFAGYVSDEELPELYAAARVFAYPSLYEGFGIPPLEAMACGTPVVASTAGALPEVLGDAALLVDPYDADALTQALEAAASDRGDLRRKGLAQASRYSWSRAAAETWHVYESVLNSA